MSVPTPEQYAQALAGFHPDLRPEELTWPGDGAGRPFRARPGEDPPLLTRAEYDALRTEYDAGVEIFDTTDPASFARYARYRGHCAKGVLIQTAYQREFRPDVVGFVIFCEWVVPYATAPSPRR